MVDLSVNLGGLKLSNPFVVASSDIGCHLGQIKEAADWGAAAFITKGCIPRQSAAGLSRKPRFRVNLSKGTLSGVAGFRRLSLDQAKELISNAKNEVAIPVGANIIVGPPSEDEAKVVTEAAGTLFESGADFIEINASANLSAHFGESETRGQTGECFMNRIAAGYSECVREAIAKVKSVVEVPVLGKVAYPNMNIPALIHAMEKAGVDAVEIGNSGMAVLPDTLDIYHPERTGKIFASADKSLGLSLFGDPLRAIAQAYLIRSAKQIKTPILACGGIMDWRHAVEAIMCGASATAMCTAFMLYGFEILKDMARGLEIFMEEQGYQSLGEFRGILVDRIALTPSEIEVFDAVARVESDKCNGCGLCIKPAQCGLERRAITLQDEVAVVDERQCSGCETCAGICPVGAITMVVKN
jgi:dihydropyrimidine dehydrogenase (NAD+) subunit PreA